jgi:hypothetical protein
MLESKNAYRSDYAHVVEDLNERFATYEKIVPAGKMERGQRRLSDVTKAVDEAATQRANASPTDRP